MEQEIQRCVSRALNEQFEAPWGAFRATTRDNMEYVELMNEVTGKRYIISIVEGM